ncbi:hypothetical protein VTJ49DRAFT_7413 [Mycothermus thermophilus]|uniref:Uncharacterized protein n=1 Tax=Humicola insolens TaxID=85995 RepID=A0ABR3VHR9_HUMIN
MAQKNNWESSLCNCFSAGCGTCLLGCFCPCFLINKTQDMIDNKPSPSSCGSMCCMFCGLSILANLSCFLGWKQRKEIRTKYGIPGNGCSDCCISTCCPCCGLIQQYNEVEERLKQPQPVVQQPAPVQGMTYVPQQ